MMLFLCHILVIVVMLLVNLISSLNPKAAKRMRPCMYIYKKSNKDTRI